MEALIEAEQPDLLTVGQVAAMAGVDTSTVRLWVKRGLLPAFQAEPRAWLRIPREDALRVVARRAKS